MYICSYSYDFNCVVPYNIVWHRPFYQSTNRKDMHLCMRMLDNPNAAGSLHRTLWSNSLGWGVLRY